jgi:ADP-ribose pyrophosphatase YjhB (NUDIX family)
MSHIHEKIDFTASAYIVCKDKVLLRYHEKYHKWIAPGGHIELEHGPIETIYKEIKEEVGLDVRIVGDQIEQSKNNNDGEVDLPVPIFMNRHRINENHEHIDMIYAAEADSMEVKPEEGEASDPKSFRWLTKEELEKLTDIPDRVKHYALVALEKVQNS